LSDLVVNPADNSRIRRLLRKQPFVKNYEFAVRRKDGGIIDGLLTLTFRKDETGEVSELQGNVHDISARKQAEAAHMRALEFRQLSITDPLTKIYNRRFFDEIATKEFERARRSGSPLTIVLFDIDHFKQVNDTFGHLTGDQVLINLANLCKANLRSMDIFARYGGEEFIILMPDADHKSAHQSIDRLRTTVAETHLATYENAPVSVTLSAGIATWKGNDPSKIRDLLKRADQALYRSKQNGRNRITIWEQKLNP